MAKARAAGARQLMIDISESLRERLDERVTAEQRTMRTVVERAITHYLDTVPLDGGTHIAAPAQPKRGRPKGKGK
jgi:hypothetical protein